ncbi:MAG: RHS repeat-associated core domain-containing protein [Aestuariibacter sp.]
MRRTLTLVNTVFGTGKRLLYLITFILLLVGAQSASFGSTDTETIVRTTFQGGGQSLAVRNSTQLLVDDFEDGDALGWSPKTGIWNVVSSGSNTTYRQVIMGESYTSYKIEQSGKLAINWNMKFKDGGTSSTTKAGMRFLANKGHTNHGNSYLLWQTPSALKLIRYKDNAVAGQKVAYEVGATLNQSYAYRVSFEAGTINVWRDGELVLTWTDPNPKTGGSYIGLRTSNSKVVFDNIRVTQENNLVYLHSDHLGGATAMSDTGGNKTGEINRFYPFGEYRTGGESEYTDQGFTGHKENRDIGLTYMNARFYVPGIGRFASADSIVPDQQNPQTFSRFSYVNNSPLNLIDPSGHCGADVIEVNDDTGETVPNTILNEECVLIRDQLLNDFGIPIEGEWRLDQIMAFSAAFRDFVSWAGGIDNVVNGEFGTFLDAIYLEGNSPIGALGCYGSICQISYSQPFPVAFPMTLTSLNYGDSEFVETIYHELMHVYVASNYNVLPEWESFSGWDLDYYSQTWNAVSPLATDYANATSNTAVSSMRAGASEEHLADFSAKNVFLQGQNTYGVPDSLYNSYISWIHSLPQRH